MFLHDDCQKLNLNDDDLGVDGDAMHGVGANFH